MNIIICGAGRVGFTISKLLSEQGHSITVIDQSSEDIQKINDTLDVKAIVGKATYPSILEKANATETDMIIAVTRNDEINMLICQIAFSIFNIQKKIARIRSQDYLNPKFTTVYNKENLPIDVIISPEIEIAKSIQRKLEAPGALDSVPFADNKIRLLEILINDGCSLIDIKLKDLTKKYPNIDANVIGITISKEQFGFAKSLIKEAGLQDKVDLRLMDYRDIQGKFDKIVSIEMFEAVGRNYWQAYFSTISRVLGKGGRAVVQSITIDHAAYHSYENQPDFIQRYIFPGGMLPSLPMLERPLMDAGLHLVSERGYASHYALSLIHI